MHTVEDYKIVSFVYNQLADVLGSEVGIDFLLISFFLIYVSLPCCLKTYLIKRKSY